jgi:hypothetical protein
MSVKVMSLVWEHFPKGGSEKLTMLALADWCNDEGKSLHPSIPRVAKKINSSECQARRLIHGLIDDGYLTVVGNYLGGNPKQTRQYELNVKKLLTPSASDSPIVHDTPSADDSPTPSTHAHIPLAPMHVTPSASATQYISEPSIEPPVNIKTKKPPFDARKFLSEQGCSDDVIEDWLTLRKKKGASNTKTALDPIVKESHKAGMTVEQALIECCSRNWQGFKADWLTPKQNATNGYKSIHDDRKEAYEILTGRKTNAHTERDITAESRRIA